jgi:hypothetical protein
VAPVWVGERQRSRLPIRIGRLDSRLADPLDELGDGGLGVEVQHEQVLRVGLRGAVIAARSELQVRTAAWEIQEDPGVTVVVTEPPISGNPTRSR